MYLQFVFMWTELRIILCLSLACSAWAEIIDSSRRVTWQGYVGIDGGIPSVTSIWTNIPDGASWSYVESAIYDCPSNMVVQLAAGSYTWGSDNLHMKSGVVLRGAGATSTLVSLGLTSDENITLSGSLTSDFTQDANLSEDAVKGGTSVTLASVPGWVTVGELIGIDQTDDAAFASNSGIEPANSLRTQAGQGTRSFGQLNKVLNKTGTTITLETPLYYGFKTANTAQIFQPGYNPSTGNSIKRAGVENMAIKCLGTGSLNSRTIFLQLADSCWVKDCIISNIYGGSAIFTAMAYRCEFRGNTIHHSALYTGGSGYAISLYYYTAGCLIDDNIAFHMHNGYNADGSSGNAYTHNVIFDGYTGDTRAHPGLNSHMTHSYGNIWEANWTGDGLDWDWTHGSSSHQTAFRNRILGTNGTPPSVSGQRTCAMIFYYQRYCNVVGNILGFSGYHDKRVVHQGSQSSGSLGDIFRCGGWDVEGGDWDPYDAYSYTTGMYLLDHMNYDVVTSTNSGIVWEGAVEDHTLASSYVYSSKPTNFGILSWPPYDPASPTVDSITNIPAGYRWINGTNPPAGEGGGPAAPSRLRVLNQTTIQSIRGK